MSMIKTENLIFEYEKHDDEGNIIVTRKFPVKVIKGTEELGFLTVKGTVADLFKANGIVLTEEDEVNSKLDDAQVTSKISAAVNPVNAKVDTNTQAIAKEVSDRQLEITRVEGALNSAKTELNSSISAVDSKVDTAKSDLTSSFNEKEAAIKADDSK